MMPLGRGGLTAAGHVGAEPRAAGQTAYQMGGVTGAAVHVFNRWQWRRPISR